MGGVANGRDALELIFAGASAIAIGTATFGNPTALIKVRDEMAQLLTDRGFTRFSDAIGYAHRV
jgi:dihydroorotate dehydrogenase (NAD+) catalytic subunit